MLDLLVANTFSLQEETGVRSNESSYVSLSL